MKGKAIWHPCAAIMAMLFSMPAVSMAAGNATGKVDVTEALITAVDKYRHVLIRRYDGSPRRNMDSSPSHPVVLWLEGPNAAVVDRQQLAAAGIILQDEDQVRRGQLASFIKLGNVAASEERVEVSYHVPAQASHGRLLVERKEGKLVASHVQQYRSASGARALYGALYAGQQCFSGSEMAYRWNFDLNEYAAANGNYPGDCPAPRFPTGEDYPVVR